VRVVCSLSPLPHSLPPTHTPREADLLSLPELGQFRGMPSAGSGSGSGSSADTGVDKDKEGDGRGYASDVPVLASSLDAALESARAADANRVFVIGGANVFAAALPLAERVLLTRIIEPSFEDCDVFMPDLVGGEGGGKWTRAGHDELSSWVGFDVAKGVQEEGGVKYEFEMWTLL
jgi:Dihydrofolate reductase